MNIRISRLLWIALFTCCLFLSGCEKDNPIETETETEIATETEAETETETEAETETEDFDLFGERVDLLDSYDGSRVIPGKDIAAEVSDIIRQIKDDYRDEDYRVYLHDHNLGLYQIHYVRVIGGFETDSRYAAGVKTNLVDRIYDQTKEISPEAEARLIALSSQLGITASTGSGKLNGKSEWPQQPEQLAEALRLAWEETDASSLKEPSGQRYYFQYDIEQDKPYILIYTDYYYDGTQAIGVDSYEYELKNGGELP